MCRLTAYTYLCSGFCYLLFFPLALLASLFGCIAFVVCLPCYGCGKCCCSLPCCLVTCLEDHVAKKLIKLPIKTCLGGCVNISKGSGECGEIMQDMV